MPKATCQWATSVPVVEAPPSVQKTGPPKTLAPTYGATMPAMAFPALTERPASREVRGAFDPSGAVVFTPDAARLAERATKGHGPLPSTGIQVAPRRASQPGSM